MNPSVVPHGVNNRNRGALFLTMATLFHQFVNIQLTNFNWWNGFIIISTIYEGCFVYDSTDSLIASQLSGMLNITGGTIVAKR